MNRISNQQQSGFTLLEVVVALFIVSVAMLSIMDAVSQYTENVVRLEKRMTAAWVASNELAKLRFEAKSVGISEGTNSNAVDMGGLKWRARTSVSATDVENVFLAEVRVRADHPGDAAEYASLTTAVANDL